MSAIAAITETDVEILGEDWNIVSEGGETWSVVSEGSEVWSVVPEGSETWTEIGQKHGQMLLKV